MSFDVFINFDGNCREAIEYYVTVFGVEAPSIMTYGEAPGMPMADADRDRVLYASLPIFGCQLMMADAPTDSGFICGNNIALTLGTPDRSEIERLYRALSDGGSIHMELGKTFFSDLYAMVVDRFGITWQLSVTPFQ